MTLKVKKTKNKQAAITELHSDGFINLLKSSKLCIIFIKTLPHISEVKTRRSQHATPLCSCFRRGQRTCRWPPGAPSLSLAQWKGGSCQIVSEGRHRVQQLRLR